MKPKRQLNLIFIGDPGAGKATQAAYFAKKYGLVDFDMGRSLTLLRQKNRRIDTIQKRTADKGILTPTKIVRQINRDTVTNAPRNKGILFDGHPKMLGEAEQVKRLLEQTGRTKPLVVYLKIPVAEILQRVLARKGYGKTKFNKRPDDTKTALKNRAKYYRKNIAEVVGFYKDNFTFTYIDGMGTRTEVRKRIQKAIDFYLKNYEQIHQETGRN